MLQLICTILVLFCLSLSSWASSELCSGIIIEDSPEALKLGISEKDLVCGNAEQAAYASIPNFQAQFFLRGFLQSRSYLNPRFEARDGILHVWVGKKSKLEKIKVTPYLGDSTTKLKKELERLYARKPLNPKLLDTIEAEARGFIRVKGYPCIKVESTVDPNTNEVTIHLSQTVPHTFGDIANRTVPGLQEQALDRYYPFMPDDSFDESLLILTEKRMIRSQVVDGTYFLENCSVDAKDFSLSQNFIIGPPRTFRFGVGASTEEGPIARVRWSHHRSDSMASTLGINLQTSLRTQSISFSADSFLWDKHPRRSLFSELEIKRESQITFEEVTVKVKPHLKWSLDRLQRNWIWTIGPSFEYGTFLADDTSNTRSFSSAAIEGGMRWMSHKYEIYDFHPEEGDTFQFHFSGRHPALGNLDPLLLLESSFMKLHRLSDSGRGALVAGVRLSAATTWVSNDVSLKDLPPSLKFFGGGSDDLRGFLLKTLPRNDGLGALTKLSTKFELRRTKLFDYSIEGFTFLDAALFGDQSWSTQPRLWHAPGLGLRWLSPIGVVQGFMARSLVTKPYEDLGNFYFLGIGGTF